MESMLSRDVMVHIFDLLDRSFSVSLKTRVASQTCKTWRVEFKRIRASRNVLIRSVYSKLVGDIEDCLVAHHDLSVAKDSHRFDALVPAVDEDGNEVWKTCFYVIMDVNEIFIHVIICFIRTS